jgi:hypothetical protein
MADNEKEEKSGLIISFSSYKQSGVIIGPVFLFLN